jgi:hypothetical protein
MRLSDLLHCRVLDRDGQDMGSVDDVRLVQDAPVNAGFDAGLRLDGLVVGRGGLGIRLGYHRAGVRAPWVLRRLFTRLEHRAHFVKFEDVEGWDDGVVRLRVGQAEVPQLTEI